MIVNCTGVELTKVRYYDSCRKHRNLEVPTVSREVYDNDVNRIIRKNVFGHRWVLKVNGQRHRSKEAGRAKIVVYVTVSCCILLAVASGVYFSIFESTSSPSPDNNDTVETTSKMPTETTKRVFIASRERTVEDILKSIRTHEKLDFRNDGRFNVSSSSSNKKYSYCNCSTPDHVCLKLHSVAQPQCKVKKDNNDPSGCGGWCQINIQYCKVLDRERLIHECVNNTNILQCPERHFNCGDMCIPVRKRCDGFRHCKDNVDETNCVCNLETHFHCGNNTSCLENNKKCDGRVDCWDSSDELTCNRASTCLSDEVPCSNDSLCILKEQICDGIADCADKSDEPEGCANPR